MCWIYPSACMLDRWTVCVYIVHFWKTCMSSLPLLTECIVALLSFVSITAQISLLEKLCFYIVFLRGVWCVWFPSLHHVVLFVCIVPQQYQHCVPIVTVLFLCLLFCFLPLSSSTFLANCFCLVPLSCFCCSPSSCHFLLPSLPCPLIVFLSSAPLSSPLFLLHLLLLFILVLIYLLPPGGHGWTAGAAAVSSQYVQHAVPTTRPTRLWDTPHLPSTFTF